MNSTSNAIHLNRSVSARTTRPFTGIGRILLSLTAILLVTMLLTQCIWAWDHFLRGGQDYESSTLLVLAFFCLVLLLAQSCKQSLSLLFAAQRYSAFLFRDPLLARIAFIGAISRSGRKVSPDLKMYSLPLQI